MYVRKISKYTEMGTDNIEKKENFKEIITYIKKKKLWHPFKKIRGCYRKELIELLKIKDISEIKNLIVSLKDKEIFH